MFYTSSFPNSEVPIPDTSYSPFEGEMPDGDGLTILLMQGFDPVAQFTTYINAQPNDQQHPLFIPTPSPRLYSPARQDFGRTTPVMASTLPFIDRSAPGLGTVPLPPLASSPRQQHDPSFVHVPGQQLSSGQTLPARSRNTPRIGPATEHRDRYSALPRHSKPCTCLPELTEKQESHQRPAPSNATGRAATPVRLSIDLPIYGDTSNISTYRLARMCA